jgi:hypothetical protein
MEAGALRLFVRAESYLVSEKNRSPSELCKLPTQFVLIAEAGQCRVQCVLQDRPRLHQGRVARHDLLRCQGDRHAGHRRGVHDEAVRDPVRAVLRSRPPLVAE